MMQATEHLGLILASFPFSSAIWVMTLDANPKLQKSFNSTQVGISTRGTPWSLAKALTVSLYSSLSQSSARKTILTLLGPNSRALRVSEIPFKTPPFLRAMERTSLDAVTKVTSSTSTCSTGTSLFLIEDYIRGF